MKNFNYITLSLSLNLILKKTILQELEESRAQTKQLEAQLSEQQEAAASSLAEAQAGLHQAETRIRDSEADLERLTAENSSLRLRVSEAEAASEGRDAMVAKVDALSKEKAELYDVQVCCLGQVVLSFNLFPILILG